MVVILEGKQATPISGHYLLGWTDPRRRDLSYERQMEWHLVRHRLHQGRSRERSAPQNQWHSTLEFELGSQCHMDHHGLWFITLVLARARAWYWRVVSEGLLGGRSNQQRVVWQRLVWPPEESQSKGWHAERSCARERCRLGCYEHIFNYRSNLIFYTWYRLRALRTDSLLDEVARNQLRSTTHHLFHGNSKNLRRRV